MCNLVSWIFAHDHENLSSQNSEHTHPAPRWFPYPFLIPSHCPQPGLWANTDLLSVTWNLHFQSFMKVCAYSILSSDFLQVNIAYFLSNVTFYGQMFLGVCLS